MFPAHQLQLEQLACQRAIACCSMIFHCNFKAVISCKLKGTMVSVKQVLLRILAGLAQPVEGKVRWNFRRDYKTARRILSSAVLSRPSFRRET